jgi:tyrosinase
MPEKMGVFTGGQFMKTSYIQQVSEIHQSITQKPNAMKHKFPTRRDFIRDNSTFVGLYMLFALGGCESLLNQIKHRPIRRRIDTSSPESMAQLNIYSQAVSLMSALPLSDPRNYGNQAAIHGSVVTGLFNKCPHSSEYFFPWHRYYLLYFERICQKLTGEDHFGLPYWNWAIDHSVPSPFWNTSSPLYHQPRAATAASVNDPGTFSQSNMESILNEPNFYIFGSNSSFGAGTLESGPHNSTHVFVGGDMGAGGSAVDPIFWMHHCMVDYCWANWNIDRKFDNPSDSQWATKTWNSDFVDENGNQANAEAALCVLFPLLSYQYECSTLGTTVPCVPLEKRSEKELRELEKRLKAGADVHFDIKQRIPFSNSASLAFGKFDQKELPVKFDDVIKIFEQPLNERILLNVGLARFPTLNNYFVRVFVDKPDATVQTPVDDIHYAGSFAFFGRNAEGDQGNMEHMGHKPLFIVDLTPTLRTLREKGLLQGDAPISLQFITVPIESSAIVREESLTLTKLDLLISTATGTMKK